MARQIGKMLKAREPKIVNGPEILNKYVGESEANIRKLFAEAEEEQKRVRAKRRIVNVFSFRSQFHLSNGGEERREVTYWNVAIVAAF